LGSHIFALFPAILYPSSAILAIPSPPHKYPSQSELAAPLLALAPPFSILHPRFSPFPGTLRPAGPRAKRAPGPCARAPAHTKRGKSQGLWPSRSPRLQMSHFFSYFAAQYLHNNVFLSRGLVSPRRGKYRRRALPHGECANLFRSPNKPVADRAKPALNSLMRPGHGPNTVSRQVHNFWYVG
jgi:hypothetical protein